MTIRSFYSYSVIVCVTSLLLTFFFSLPMDKRKSFWLRAGLGFIVSYFCVVFFKMIPLPFGILSTTARFGFVILVCSFFSFICFKINYRSALFLSFAAYTYRHMIYLISMILGFIIKDVFLNADLNFYVTNYLFPFVIYIFTVPLLIGLYKTIKNYRDFILVPPPITMFISGIALLADIVFNIFSMRYFNKDMLLKYCMNLINILLCIMTLVIMFGYAKQVKIQSQIAVMNQLEYERNKQFNLSKQNIEMINIKCHDLRHQIRALENISDLKIQDELKDIEKRLRIYDTKVKTGNEILDILLSEKSLLCNKNKIVLDCIIDGKQISFLADEEITSLFGNIVDNAMESVSKIQNEKKRIITLKIYSAFGGSYIVEENPYEGIINTKNGKIVTNKEDKKHHGFGMKSINNVVERHEGVLSIKTDGGIFRLQIFFPKK